MTSSPKPSALSPLARAIKPILHSKEHVASNFKSAPDNRYFEDYISGAVHEFGSIAVDEKEVIEFGKRYVPLSYHLDKEAAKNSIYGGVIASGWHTLALMMRIYTEIYLSQVANLGSSCGCELGWYSTGFSRREPFILVSDLAVGCFVFHPDPRH